MIICGVPFAAKSYPPSLCKSGGRYSSFSGNCLALSSQEIEDVFEMNFDYMNRAFSKLTDAPIFTYLNTLRIYNAQQLIATTDLPFQEIAYLVGIDDRYYFSKLFRKKTGMSPSEYYKEVRNRGDAERL